MTISVNSFKYTVFGDRAVALADIAFGSGYPSGGESFNVEQLFGIHAVDAVLIPPVSGAQFGFDETIQKLKAYRTIMAVQQFCNSILGSANTDAQTADGNALPTNGAVICAAATQADIVTALGVLTVAASPDIARNVCFCVTNDSGGALNLYVGTTTLRVTGTYKGKAQTEDISITVADAQKAIANGKYRYAYGSKPFSTITSVTQPNYETDAMADGLKISVGLGSKIAILNALATPAAGDIFPAVRKGTATDATETVDTANNTGTLGALTDGDDYLIEYNTKVHSGNEEVADGTDLSDLTSGKVLVIGV
jgi:hypothetical protein